ncbi:MAG: MFS transporter [Nanoarchaeota archaeon]|nr:MFS transporter [Nanoarchaeota archaeon]
MSFYSNFKKGITRNVLIVGMVSFFMDISSEMIFSILTLFLKNVIGASTPVIGLIEGVAESTASILKLVSGWLSDKFGRRKLFMYIGYGFSALTKPLFALATSWPLVLFARFSDRIGKGMRGTARDAILAESTEKKYRGKVFGLHRSMDTAGAILGPLLAMMLFVYIGYRGIFWIALIPALLAVLAIIPIRVKEKFKEEKFDSKNFKFSLKGMNKEYKRFLIVLGLFSFANFSYAFMMLRAQDIGVTPEKVISLYLVYNIFVILFSTPMGLLADRIGRKTVIVIGFLVFTTMMISFGFATHIVHTFFLFALYGIFTSIFESVPKAFVSDMVNKDKRGTALGIMNSVVGIMILPASLFAGLIWQYVSPSAPFFIGAGVSGVSVLMMMFLVRR